MFGCKPKIFSLKAVRKKTFSNKTDFYKEREKKKKMKFLMFAFHFETRPTLPIYAHNEGGLITYLD